MSVLGRLPRADKGVHHQGTKTQREPEQQQQHRGLLLSVRTFGSWCPLGRTLGMLCGRTPSPTPWRSWRLGGSISDSGRPAERWQGHPQTSADCAGVADGTGCRPARSGACPARFYGGAATRSRRGTLSTLEEWSRPQSSTRRLRNREGRRRREGAVVSREVPLVVRQEVETVVSSAVYPLVSASV